MSDSARDGQGLHIALALILGIVVMGFFVGVSSPPGTGSPLVHHARAQAAEGVRVMPSYRGLRASSASDSTWGADSAKLAVVGAGPEGDRTAAVSDRAANRAYDGAPPTIPHPIRQNSTAECLACHQDGLRVREGVASAMSHRELVSCTQCHVVSGMPMPGPALPPDATFAFNGFEGLRSPGAGSRAWSIAPPTIPHRTTMRERCMSCHGPAGRDALKTPHPDRQSCEQCHAPDATSDQRPVGGLE
jgi:cytochrome c-type protein NapB